MSRLLIVSNGFRRQYLFDSYSIYSGHTAGNVLMMCTEKLFFVILFVLSDAFSNDNYYMAKILRVF